MKVSFIIPVYNVEKYLQQCVDSIIVQSHKDIEVILVDDGSSDTSPKLCDNFAESDSRIISLHKENGGLSDARNFGLRYATGDYVVFLDSDDFWLCDDSISKLVGLFVKHPNLDFIGFNCCYYYPDVNHFKKWQPLPEHLCHPVDKNSALQYLSRSGLFPVSACMKILNRKFLISNSLFFKVGQKHEDIPWFVNVMDKCRKCMFINDYIYSYRQANNSSSITHSVSANNIDSIIRILNNECSILSKRSFNENAKDSLLSFLAYELIMAFASLYYLSKDEFEEWYKRLLTFKWLFKYEENPKVKKFNTLRKIIGQKLAIRCMYYYMNNKK